MTRPTALVFIEYVLWEPTDDWARAVEHLAERFRRAHPLDAAAVLAAGDLTAQLELLAAWSSESGADLDRELGRWFDEHLSMHLRPDPTRTRAVRALAASHDLHAASALPPRVAEAIARHAGAWRSFVGVQGDVRTPETLVAALSDTEAALVVGDAAHLEGLAVPATVRVESLAAAARDAS